MPSNMSVGELGASSRGSPRTKQAVYAGESRGADGRGASDTRITSPAKDEKCRTLPVGCMPTFNNPFICRNRDKSAKNYRKTPLYFCNKFNSFIDRTTALYGL